MSSNSRPTTVYDLVKPVSDRYNCMICFELLVQPALVSCCGQHFCEDCLKKWQREKKGKSCPHCKSKTVTYIVNKERVRDINELEVYCSNKTKGCDWKGELQSLTKHVEASCQLVEIDCPKQCKLKLLRAKMNDHVTNECLCRDYSCEHCDERGTYHTITGECGEFGPCELHDEGHYNKCEQYPLMCTNECSTTVPRWVMGTHRNICPLEKVQCTFSEVGCSQELIRKDLNNHIATSDHQHLLMMIKSFKQLQTRVTTQDQEKQELEKRVATLEKKEKKLQTRVVTLEKAMPELQRSAAQARQGKQGHVCYDGSRSYGSPSLGSQSDDSEDGLRFSQNYVRQPRRQVRADPRAKCCFDM